MLDLRVVDQRVCLTGGFLGGTWASMGLSAVLHAGAMEILITSRPTYDWADEQYRAAGMDVRRAEFVGVKNPMNHRLAYGEVAKATFIVDTPGPTAASLRRLPYKRVHRPLFPLDEDIPHAQVTVTP